MGGDGVQQYEALQLVTLNMKEKKVQVNQDALDRLQKSLKATGAEKVAIISVMGAFRTGKSFLLDLFLRYLRYEQRTSDGAGGPKPRPAAPERGGNEEYPLPEWLVAAGATLEGASDESKDGFRFKGGMDHCTEGIWCWSEPFVRKVDGERVALLLMDTQGAWDGNLTKEQSATIFGLTALISSKQVYNINMQIQQDKVENMAYFMRFAQAALRRAMQVSKGNMKEVERPFQSLDFLVRDWANFEDEWTMAQCKEQMTQHMDKHLNPEKVVENSAAEALQAMFGGLHCFCMPHPGGKIQKAAWNGNVSDINRDFIRFMDEYVHSVFGEGITAKKILGSDLSPSTFPLVFRQFVEAFEDAAPAAMSFTEAMTQATVLVAKDKAMKAYTKRMSEATAKCARGMEPKAFQELHRSLSSGIEEEYEGVTILGDDKTRETTWKAIEENLSTLYKQYMEENERRLEKALVVFGNLALLALITFVSDRMSDFTCDWWSDTCRNFSKVLFMVYMTIMAYVGYQVYVLYKERGSLATSAAAMELWKEVLRLVGVYGCLLQSVRLEDVRSLSLRCIDLGKEASARAFAGARDVKIGKGKKD